MPDGTYSARRQGLTAKRQGPGGFLVTRRDNGQRFFVSARSLPQLSHRLTQQSVTVTAGRVTDVLTSAVEG